MQTNQATTKSNGSVNILVLPLPEQQLGKVRKPTDSEAEAAIVHAALSLTAQGMFEQGQALARKDAERKTVRNAQAIRRAFLYVRFLTCFAPYCRGNPGFITSPVYAANVNAKPDLQLCREFYRGYQDGKKPVVA